MQTPTHARPQAGKQARTHARMHKRTNGHQSIHKRVAGAARAGIEGGAEAKGHCATTCVDLNDILLTCESYTRAHTHTRSCVQANIRVRQLDERLKQVYTQAGRVHVYILGCLPGGQSPGVGGNTTDAVNPAVCTHPHSRLSADHSPVRRRSHRDPQYHHIRNNYHKRSSRNHHSGHKRHTRHNGYTHQDYRRIVRIAAKYKHCTGTTDRRAVWPATKMALMAAAAAAVLMRCKVKI